MAYRFDSLPKEVTFRHKGETLHPEGVFSILYDGLEALIDQNRRQKAASRAINAKNLDFASRKKDGQPLKQQWLDRVKDIDIDAEIKFDNASSRTYKVMPRINFDPNGAIKFPSIVLLKDETGNMAILREARVYDFDGFVKPLISRKWENKFDINASMQFYDPDTKEIRPAKRSKAMYVPEPQLVEALEHLYFQQDGVPRITPRMHAVDSSEDRLWYLRTFLPIASDVALEPSQVGQFLGVLHSLGLMENMDRQLIHYYSNEGHLGTYDPDLMLHSANPGLIGGCEYDDITKVIQSEGETHGIFGCQKDYLAEVKEASKVMQARLQSEGLEPVDFVNQLRPDIKVGPYVNQVELRR